MQGDNTCLTLDCGSATEATCPSTSVGIKGKKKLMTSNFTFKRHASFRNMKKKTKVPKLFFLIHTCSFTTAGRTRVLIAGVLQSTAGQSGFKRGHLIGIEDRTSSLHF